MESFAKYQQDFIFLENHQKNKQNFIQNKDNQHIFVSSESPILENDKDQAPFISPRLEPSQIIDSEKRLLEQKIGDKYVDFAINDKNLSQNVIRLADLKMNKIDKIILQERRSSIMTDEESRSIGSLLREEIEKQDQEQQQDINNQTDQLFEKSQIQENQENNNQIQDNCQNMQHSDESLFDFSFDDIIDTEPQQKLQQLNQDLCTYLIGQGLMSGKSSCVSCQFSNHYIQDFKCRLIQIENDLVQSLQTAKIQIKHQLQAKQIKYKMLNIELKNKISEINQQQERLRQKEEDLNFEVQSLLNTIDDHKKVNQRLNKHYQKRFKNLERDLVSLLNIMIDQNGGLVGYNGILISANQSQKFLTSLSKQQLISQRHNNAINQGVVGMSLSNVSSRNILDKTTNIINSHRQGGFTIKNTLANNLNQTSPHNITSMQIQLSEIIQKLREQMELKVRLKDPLDENAAHLIASSRMITQRGSYYQNGNPQQTARTINKCKSSARLDQAFVQNTSRSNMNQISSRANILNGFKSGQQTQRKENNKHQPVFDNLCDTCLSNQYSMYSIEEEQNANKENQSDLINQTLIKEYLGGQDPNQLSLSERDKILSKILMKDYESKQLQDAQHVKWQDILNYQHPPKPPRALQPIQYTEKSESHASQQLQQLDSKKSSENFNKFIHDLSAIPVLKQPSSDLLQRNSLKEDLEDISMITGCEINMMKSFDNSFSLVDQVVQSQKSSALAMQNQIDNLQQQQQLQHKKPVVIPILNLDKIRTQQNEFFKNNIKDPKQQSDKKKKVQFDYQNLKLNDNSSFLSNKDILQTENLNILNEELNKEAIQDQTLNLEDSSIHIENLSIKPIKEQLKGNNILKIGDSLILSPIHVKETPSQVDRISLFSNEIQIQNSNFQFQHQQRSKVNPFSSDKGIQQQQPQLEILNIKQKLSDNFEINNNVFSQNQQQFESEIIEDTLTQNFKKSRQIKLSKDSSTNKLIQNLDDLFNPTQYQHEQDQTKLEEQKQQNILVNNSQGFKQSPDKKKIIIKRGDIQLRKNSKESSNGSQGAQSQIVVQSFFNKNANDSLQSNNFTLGVCKLNSNENTKDSIEQAQIISNNVFANQPKVNQSLVINQINDSQNTIESLMPKRIRQNSAKNRPVIAKQINTLFGNQGTQQRTVNKSEISDHSDNSSNLVQRIKTNSIQDQNISKDLIQLTEYLTLTNQIPKPYEHQNINNTNIFNKIQSTSPTILQQQMPIKISRQQLFIKPNQSIKLESISFSQEQKQSQNTIIQSYNTQTNTNQPNKQQSIQINKINLSKIKIKNLKPINLTAANISQITSNNQTSNNISSNINLNESQNQVQNSNISTQNKLDQSSVILTQPVLLKRPIMKINKASIINKTNNEIKTRNNPIQVIQNNSNSNESSKISHIIQQRFQSQQPNDTNLSLKFISNKSQNTTQNNLTQNSIVKQSINSHNFGSNNIVNNNNNNNQHADDNNSQKPQLSHRYLMRRGLNKPSQNQNTQQQQIIFDNNYPMPLYNFNQSPLVNMNNHTNIFQYKSQTPKYNPNSGNNSIQSQMAQSLLQMNQTISNTKSSNNLQGSNSKQSDKSPNNSSRHNINSKKNLKKMNNKTENSIQNLSNSSIIKQQKAASSVNQTQLVNKSRLKILRTRVQKQQQLLQQQQQDNQNINNNSLSSRKLQLNSKQKSNINNSSNKRSNNTSNSKNGGSSSHRQQLHQQQQFVTFYNDFNQLRFNLTSESIKIPKSQRDLQQNGTNNSNKKSKQGNVNYQYNTLQNQQQYQQQLVNMNQNYLSNQANQFVNNNDNNQYNNNNNLYQTSSFRQHSARSQGSKVNSARRQKLNTQKNVNIIRHRQQ